MMNREAFEKWWNAGDEIANSPIQFAWEAWQAAKADSAEQVEQLQREVDRLKNALTEIRRFGLSSGHICADISKQALKEPKP